MVSHLTLSYSSTGSTFDSTPLVLVATDGAKVQFTIGVCFPWRSTVIFVSYFVCFRKRASSHSLNSSSNSAVGQRLARGSCHPKFEANSHTPDICKYYNNRGGCKKTADKTCQALHLCIYFVKGHCKYKHCWKSHDVHDEQPRRILEGLGWNMQRNVVVILQELRQRWDIEGIVAISIIEVSAYCLSIIINFN